MFKGLDGGLTHLQASCMNEEYQAELIEKMFCILILVSIGGELTNPS